METETLSLPTAYHSTTFHLVQRGLTLQIPYFFVTANLINRKVHGDDSISYIAIFAPLIVVQVTSSIPSILILLSRTEANIVSAAYRRIVARRTIQNGILRGLFFGLLTAKLEGAIAWSFRLITVPIWLQLLAVMVMLHTEVKRLQDATCERAFKKQSASIEIQLLASVFIAMKLDEVISWSWLGVLWPLWLPTGVLCLSALLLTCFMPCFLCLLACDRQRRFAGNAHPVLLVALWTGFLFCSVCSFVFLLRLGQHLDGDAAVAPNDFMVPVLVLLVFFLVVELYLFVFGMGILQRLALQHQQMLMAGASRAGADPQAQAAEAEARTNAVINGEKPRLLVRIATDIYRKGTEAEEGLLTRYKGRGGADGQAEPGGEEEETGFVPVVWEVEEEAGTEAQKCVVCWEGDRETVLLECGHGCCCFVCARRVIMDGQPCPMCRGPIRQVALIDHSKASDIPMATLLAVSSDDAGGGEGEGGEGGGEDVPVDEAVTCAVEDPEIQGNSHPDPEISAARGTPLPSPFASPPSHAERAAPASVTVNSTADYPAPTYAEPAGNGHQLFTPVPPSPSPSPPSERILCPAWRNEAEKTGGEAGKEKREGQEGEEEGDEAAARELGVSVESGREEEEEEEEEEERGSSEDGRGDKAEVEEGGEEGPVQLSAVQTSVTSPIANVTSPDAGVTSLGSKPAPSSPDTEEALEKTVTAPDAAVTSQAAVITSQGAEVTSQQSEASEEGKASELLSQAHTDSASATNSLSDSVTATARRAEDGGQDSAEHRK